MLKNFKKNIQKYLPYFILGIGFVLGVFRLLPYISTQIPLGYDPGIYIFLFEDYGQLLRNFDFTLLADRNKHEPLLGILAALLGKIGISGERLVRRGIGIVSLLPGFILAAIFRKKNKLVGVISALFYRISITQYETFFRAYFKQIIGISILLLCLYFLQNKKSIFFGIAILLLVLLHRHTALYGILIIILYLISNSIREKKVPRKILITILGFGIIGSLVYRSQRESLFLHGWEVLTTTFLGKGMGGIFMQRQERLKIAIIPIILSLVGVFVKIKNKEYDVRIIGYFLGLIRIILQLVNYNRTLIFLDIFVIILAAHGIKFIIKTYKNYGRIILLISFSVSSILYIKHYNQHSEPLITESEFQAIQSLQTMTEENSIIMLTHRNYTPRIMGYSDRDRISPGYSDLDARTRDQRTIRRTSNGTVKCQMLKNYYSDINRPIYLRLGSQQHPENLQGTTCINFIEIGPTHKIAEIIL